MAAPTVTIVVADSSIVVGETSTVTFTFSEEVIGFTNADLTIANGTLSPVNSGDGITWTATFTPTAGITDATNAITLDLSGVTDLGATSGVGTQDSNNYAVDTARPTATIVLADTALAVGETSLVTVTFSEAVTGFTGADLTVASGAVSGLSSADGGITWTATFTPTAATTDASNLITLANTGVADAAGNVGSGTTDSNNYAVDTARPTATIVLADTALAVGETSLVTITFSEAVTSFTNADLTIDNGTLSAVVTGDNITYTATFTPTDALADATNVITLANSGVQDAALNAGIGTSTSANFTIDTTQAPPPPPPAPPVNMPGSTLPDVIVGNDLNNTVAAGAGNDTANGGLGSDSIAGDAGDDVLQGNVGADSLAGGTGADVVLGGQDNDVVQGNSGADHVTGDKGSDTVHGGQDNDVVYGGEDDDYASGDNGDDVVRGGQGDDRVLGGDGDDFVSGDKGSDTVTGGLGSDLFHTSGGAGLDLVTDFSLTEGDRVMLDPGTIYTATQVGADTVIDMDGGGQMILAGVQLSTLTEGWIYGG